jgi:hypothetical protein
MVAPTASEVVPRSASPRQLGRMSIPTYSICYKLGKQISGSYVRVHTANSPTHRKLMTAKGAHVVIASPTPNNLWETGTWSYTAPRFTGYGRSVVTSLGSLAAFVDHGLYVANEYKALGATAVNAFYPVDHTHTSPAGAESVAGQFVKGLKCGGSALSAYVTASISGSCY